MCTADKLLELMFSWIEQRERCARQLKNMAEELESLREKCNVGECVGSTASVVGAGFLIGAGVASVLTGGAAAPVLGLIGAVCTGGGVTVSVTTKIIEHFSSSDTMKEAQEIEKKSDKIAEKIQKHFERLKAEVEEMNPSTDPDEVDRLIMTKILGAVAKRSGQQFNFDMFAGLPFSFDVGPTNRNLFGPQLTFGLAGILAFFTFQGSGKGFKLLLDKGGQQLLKQLSAVGLSTVLKGGAKIMGGAVGLAFALPEAIDNWIDLIKNNHVTEASQSLRDTANDILKISRTLREQLDKIKELLEELAYMKRCIANSNRSDEDRQKMIQYVIERCEDEVVVQWLRENSASDIFFRLVDMFHYLQTELDKRKGEIDSRENIHIIFVAHGAIDEWPVPASCLRPLPTIEDVLLYSPWNCVIDASVAYGIATGRIMPQHRVFYCNVNSDCQVPHEFHLPTKPTFHWNSMKESRGWWIPNISVTTLKKPKDDAWNGVMFLQDTYGAPGKNRVVIPFILPDVFGLSVTVPFFVVTLALSLVLLFSSYKATVHLAACLGKGSPGRPYYFEDNMNQQYVCTIDYTAMGCSEAMVRDENTVLFRALRAVFG